MKKKTYLVVLFIIEILMVSAWVVKEGIKDGRKVMVNSQN